MYSADSWTSGNLPHDIGLLLSDGVGGYTDTTLPLGITSYDPMRMVTADFNGDGLDDVALGRTDGLTVLSSDGATLGAELDLVALGWALAAPVQVNLGKGDGVNEVAFLDGARLILHLGEWAGGVTAVTDLPSSLYGAGWMTPGDVDGDGDADMITSTGWTSEVLLQDAGLGWQGAFEAQQDAIFATVGQQLQVAGDTNGDGCDDYVLFDSQDGFRVSPSRAPGCDGFDLLAYGTSPDTGADTAADTATDTATDTASDSGTDTASDTAAHSSFTSDEDPRWLCSTGSSRTAGSLGVLLAAFAVRRRRS